MTEHHSIELKAGDLVYCAYYNCIGTVLALYMGDFMEVFAVVEGEGGVCDDFPIRMLTNITNG